MREARHNDNLFVAVAAGLVAATLVLALWLGRGLAALWAERPW